MRTRKETVFESSDGCFFLPFNSIEMMKMKWSAVLLIFLLLQGFVLQGTAQQSGHPKLVVGIVVDQMRWDYLYRYENRYGEGGFKRLLHDGFSCENTFITHLPSFTAVGHTTIFTGSVPAIHGITGNDFIDQQTGEKRYCTQDDEESTVGSPSVAGKMSPRQLLASTITDELKLATNFRSRVVGVSLKDRAAILPAGHMPDAAFWFDDQTGNFITSTYYMKELPEWVQKFNVAKWGEKLTAEGWKTLLPLAQYDASTADDASTTWEGNLPGERNPVFPHDLAKLYKQNPGNIRTSPFGNTITLNFARAAVDAYALGNGSNTDFLTINCASTDYVGHKFGPNSVEVEDTYLRLDRDLASFFSYLDKKLGKGQYLVFLTADHGAAHSQGFMKAHRLPSGIFDGRRAVAALNLELEKRFGIKGLVKSELNYHLNFDINKIRGSKYSYDEVKEAAVSFMQTYPGIQWAVDVDHIGTAPIPQPVREMIINGYNPKRTGSVILIPEPGWFEGFAKGTTHGNWNPYDTHIPLLFMGWHIKHGFTNKKLGMTDIAPTLAALLHIQMPSGSVGQVITEITQED